MYFFLQLKDLAKSAKSYDNFSEADQFMYQLAKIERYEARLNCMAYMGNFDELLNSTKPVSWSATPGSRVFVRMFSIRLSYVALGENCQAII